MAMFLEMAKSDPYWKLLDEFVHAQTASQAKALKAKLSKLSPPEGVDVSALQSLVLNLSVCDIFVVVVCMYSCFCLTLLFFLL